MKGPILVHKIQDSGKNNSAFIFFFYVFDLSFTEEICTTRQAYYICEPGSMLHLKIIFQNDNDPNVRINDTS